LKVTLEDVKARRHEYAYPEAWQYQLRKYEAGLALFESDADKVDRVMEDINDPSQFIAEMGMKGGGE
jgi:hypothetical protein